MKIPDQTKSTQEVKADMESDRPMDRLVCDVGLVKQRSNSGAFKAVDKANKSLSGANNHISVTLPHLYGRIERHACFYWLFKPIQNGQTKSRNLKR
jgi:hypothetical protein